MSSNFDSICYPRNFLAEVIARADFLSTFSFSDESLPKNILDIALSEFPIPDPRTHEAPKEIRKIFEGLVAEPAVSVPQFPTIQEWHFHSEDRRKSLVIAPNAVWVSYRKYSTFEELERDFMGVVNKILEREGKATPKRLGLRYVNVVDANPTEGPLNWSGYFSEALLGALNTPPEDERRFLARAMSDVELTFGTTRLHIRAGVQNPDFPAPVRQRAFVLDLDAYTQVSFENNRLNEQLREFHFLIQRYFERLVGEKLHAALGA